MLLACQIAGIPCIIFANPYLGPTHYCWMNRLLFLIILIIFPGSFAIAQQTLGLFVLEEGLVEGYTLLAPTNSEQTYLIDNCGEWVHRWDHDIRPGEATYLLENGDLVRTQRRGGSSMNGGGIGGGIEIRDWDGNMKWEHLLNTNEFHSHHDIELLPNGNILVLGWSLVSKAEAVGLGRNPEWVSNFGMFEEVIWELEILENNEANVVWEWRAFDHIIQDFDSTKANYGVVSEHPELMNFNYNADGGGAGGGQQDWLHFNAIDYNDSLKQIALSSRHIDEIWIIEYSDSTSIAAAHEGGLYGKGGDILYRWGNPAAYNRGTADDQQFWGQHNVQWIPYGYPDGGKLIVYNNGTGRPGGNYSTIDIIDPPINADGTYSIDSVYTFGPETYSWTYTADPPNSLFSVNISGASRYKNGNTIIAEGRSATIYEVDTMGNVLWKYVSPVGPFGPQTQGEMPNGNLFRAERYGPDFPAFSDKKLQPQGPIELDPLLSLCDVSAVENSIPNDPIKIYPNPARVSITIELNQVIEMIQVYDTNGDIIYKSGSEIAVTEIDISQWQPGLFVVLVDGRYVGKFLVLK